MGPQRYEREPAAWAQKLSAGSCIVIAQAQTEAGRLDDSMIATEHLLLGLSHDETVQPIFTEHGITTKPLRDRVLFLHCGSGIPENRGIGIEGKPVRELPLTLEAIKSIELALEISNKEGALNITPLHILRGILRGREARLQEGQLPTIGQSLLEEMGML